MGLDMMDPTNGSHEMYVVEVKTRMTWGSMVSEAVGPKKDPRRWDMRYSMWSSFRNGADVGADVVDWRWCRW